jgi:GMP synthase (glutamine-hydrolysing)
MESFVNRSVKEIKELVKNDKVLCAVSGGVDSTTLAVLLNKAIKSNLTCLFVDNGLLRKDEDKLIPSILGDRLGLNLIHLNRKEQFLGKIKGIEDPEDKRKVIGEEFARVFVDFSKENGPFQWLAQGTLYPDVIESGVSKGPAAIIKTHHNVGGLPEWLKMRVLEPFRSLYKDEVRKVGRLLGIPDEFLMRHPFPGPGLAVRIIGKVTDQKISIVRHASSIVEDELKKVSWYDKVWQAYATVGDDRAVGVLGDERVYGYIVTVRVVESSDAMTADWSRLPYEVLQTISNRITNEVDGVTWVTYAISSKPPATIEPQ